MPLKAWRPRQPFKYKRLGHPQRKPKIGGLLSVPRKDLGWAAKQNLKGKTQNTSAGRVSRVWGEGGVTGASGAGGPRRTLVKPVTARS